MIRSEKIPLSYNSIDAKALANVLRDFEGRSHEEILEYFESKLCEVTQSPYAVALSSGTAAIHLAMQVLGVGKDDLVPVSTFTYIGSVNPICYQEAHPVFIDSEMDTWNMDPNFLQDYLKQTKKLPKAIEVVHTYGMPAKMDELLEVASRFEVPIIEDAAAGLGGRWHGRPLGSIGEVGVISFNNNKTVTAFGGGALLTKSKKIYDRVKFLAAQARENKPYYEFNEVGYNYRMSPLSALYGIEQLKIIDERVTTRKKIRERYVTDLSEISQLSFQQEPLNFQSSWWLPVVLILRDVTRDQLQIELEKFNIESRFAWKPMHQQPAFKQYQYLGNGSSDSLFAKGLCLPTGHALSEADQSKIIDLIKAIFIR